MPFRVHILEKPDEPFQTAISAALSPSIELTWGEFVQATDFEVLVAGVPSREQLEISERLSTLVIPWAGLPGKTRELLRDFPHLAVYNLHHNAIETAEMALTLMLACAKLLIPSDRELRRHNWSPRYEPAEMYSLDQRTALILGFGKIGRRIDAGCRGLGMNTIAVRRTAATSKEPALPVSKLDELLPHADVLFVCLPLTPETTGLIGPEQLALLPDNAIIVNIARGPVIDEKALFEELKGGRLRAGLDVWYRYPRNKEERIASPPSEYGFESLDNVVMTPHLAGHSTIVEKRRAEALAEVLNCLADGKKAPNRVDPDRGY